MKSVLGGFEKENALAWYFAVRTCQQYLRHIKKSEDEAQISKELHILLGMTCGKARFLYDLYSNSHPNSIGKLLGIEFDLVLAYENELAVREWFYLLGVFACLRGDTIQENLQSHLDDMKEQQDEASNCMGCFIRATEISALRYKWLPDQILMRWLIDMIREYELNGTLLEMYELEWLRDKSNFKFNVNELLAFVRSRMELEQKTRRSNSSFTTLPYDFCINVWCLFDKTSLSEVEAFGKFCLLVLGSSFTAIYRIPKYIEALDPSGQNVADFICQYLITNLLVSFDDLARLARLASAYPESSEAWRLIATPICHKIQALQMPREDRRRIFYCLSKKETGVLSCKRGEVPEYYIQACSEAEQMLDKESNNSPLHEYRMWALQHAKENLSREQGCAEELAND